MGALSLGRLNDLSRQLTFGETGHAYLVDHKWYSGGHPNTEGTSELRCDNVSMVSKAMAGEVGRFHDPLEEQESWPHICPSGYWMEYNCSPKCHEAFASVRDTLEGSVRGEDLTLVFILFAFWVSNFLTDLSPGLPRRRQGLPGVDLGHQF